MSSEPKHRVVVEGRPTGKRIEWQITPEGRENGFIYVEIAAVLLKSVLLQATKGEVTKEMLLRIVSKFMDGSAPERRFEA